MWTTTATLSVLVALAEPPPYGTRTYVGPFTGANRSAEVLEYISKLTIPDPLFYEVFSEDEIFSFFQPDGPPVPVYAWTDGPVMFHMYSQCEAGATDPTAFGRGETVWKDFLHNYPHNVKYPEEALLHFVPSLMAARSRGECAVYNQTFFEELYQDIFESKYFQAFGGSNFFAPHAFYTELIHSIGNDREFWEGGAYNQVQIKFMGLLARLPLALYSGMQACQVVTSYLPVARFRSLESWPFGPLESYLYPGGIYEQFKKNRPYNFVFVGQADGREAYRSRRQAFEFLPGFMEPNLIIRRPNEVLIGEYGTCKGTKPCGDLQRALKGELVPDVSGCCEVPENFDKRYFNEFTLRGKFSLHMRGDDWSSARIADIISAQTIPVVVMKEALSVSLWNECQVPWQLMAVFIDHQDFIENPQAALDPVVELFENPLQMERKLRLLEYYRLKLAYKEVNGLGMEDVLREVVSICVPETAAQAMGTSTVDYKCPFGYHSSSASFPNRGDEDFATPWGDYGVHMLAGNQAGNSSTHALSFLGLFPTNASPEEAKKERERVDKVKEELAQSVPKYLTELLDKAIKAEEDALLQTTAPTTTIPATTTPATVG